MTRVLIVDDSTAMRGLIGAVLRRDPQIQVVGEAKDPLEARQAIKDLSPDVLTLDVEMPKMNGLEFLERLMRLRPMPVIMVSTLTQRGADASVRALELGAFDCIAKPAPGEIGTLDQLPAMVKLAVNSARRRNPQPMNPPPAAVKADGYTPGRRIVAIGSSTGGVEALSTVLTGYPANCPPTIIAQHMPVSFIESLAGRLDKRFAPTIAVAAEGTPLLPGHVYFAPGGQTHLEIVQGSPARCRLRPAEGHTGFRPSVDLLFHSIALAAPSNAVGVIMTGMGQDGAQGLLAMRKAGAITIGQDEATCVIYGMPKAAFEIGAVERQVPLDKIAAEILSVTRLKQEGKS
jgi:two-component system, chemotaxis family, protein-glutamate methylesterase/glutaminase